MNALPEYKLNPENARTVATGAWLTQTGKYIGKITGAEYLKSSSGANGIQLSFESNTGLKTNFLNLWLENGKGESLYGRKVLDALMTCLKLRGIKAQHGIVKRDDGKQEEATIFPDFIGKSIGFLLEREEYVNNAGALKARMVIVAPFDAHDERIAIEILDNKPAGTLPKLVAQLKDRPAKNRPLTGTAPPATGGIADLDDDIPF